MPSDRRHLIIVFLESWPNGNSELLKRILPEFCKKAVSIKVWRGIPNNVPVVRVCTWNTTKEYNKECHWASCSKNFNIVEMVECDVRKMHYWRFMFIIWVELLSFSSFLSFGELTFFWNFLQLLLFISRGEYSP